MNIDTIKTQIHLLTAERPLPLEKPKVIQFPVIDICNSRCQMCRIWENKKSDDISVEELKKGLSDPLFSEVQSIGFNGGEPTLRKDLTEIVKVTTDCLPSLRNVSLITNAYKYKEVNQQIEQMGKVLRKRKINFDVMISLDGYGEVHDNVRGRKGNFERAQHVIDFVKKSPLVDSVRIGCTVIRENVNYLPDLLEYCIRNDLYVKFRLGIPHQRLYTENLQDPYALTFEEKYEFVEFLEGLIEHYEPSIMQRFFYRSLADQIKLGAPRKAGCDWQYRGATITARGELAYCAVQSKVLAENIADSNNMSSYFGNKEHLNSILKNHCDTCHHDYVGVPNKKEYRKLFLQRIDKKIGFKRNIKKVPGYRIARACHSYVQYNKSLEYFKSIPEQINVVEENNKDVYKKNVLICGWYGTETLGDKAIIGGIIQTFRKYLPEGAKFTVASLNPYVTEMTHRQMAEFDGVRIVSIEEAIELSSKMDFVLFGGGPLMAIPSLAPMQIIFERANKAGAVTLATGVGVGPLGERWLNKSIARILNLCDYKLYRDEKSKTNAESLGVNTKNDYVVEDPAFTWLSSLPKSNRSASDTGKKVLLLGLRDFPYREYAKDIPLSQALSIKKNYESEVVKAIRELVKNNDDLIVRPLPMCTNHYGGDDRWFYRQLFRKCDDIASSLDYSLLGKELSPIEYVQKIQNSDALLAMRFHSLVFGITLNINSVAIDYTMGKGKVKSLGERFSIPLLGINNLRAEEIVSNISTQINRSPQYIVKREQLKFDAAIADILNANSSRNKTGSVLLESFDS